MRNVALNGERSFLICSHSRELSFTEYASKRLQPDNPRAAPRTISHERVSMVRTIFPMCAFDMNAL